MIRFVISYRTHTEGLRAVETVKRDYSIIRIRKPAQKGKYGKIYIDAEQKKLANDSLIGV